MSLKAAVFNVLFLTVIPALAFREHPFSSSRKVSLFEASFEPTGVDRRLLGIVGGLTAVALFVPAVLGIAPVQQYEYESVGAVVGFAYVGAVVISGMVVAFLAGTERLHRRLATAARAYRPGTGSGDPVLVRGTVEALDDEKTQAESVDGKDCIVYDFRRIDLVRDFGDSVAPLRSDDPFVLNAEGGRYHVDPSGACFHFEGRDLANRCLEAGEELTVLGTPSDGPKGARLTAENGVLYITADPPDTLRSRIARDRVKALLFMLVLVPSSVVLLWLQITG